MTTKKTKKTARKMPKMTAVKDSVQLDDPHIIFDSNVRKTFVEGIIQDIKGYFEGKTNGLVEVVYEDFNLKNHEFGFKIHVSKRPTCTKQMFSETASAIVNTVNYAFPGGNEQYGISVFSEDNKFDFEIVSNW